MSNQDINAAKKTEIENLLHQINAQMQTPESMGRILMNALLSEAASKGTFMADGTIEIPMTATIRLPGSKGLTTSSVCGESCIKILGTNVVCVSVCHHET